MTTRKTTPQEVAACVAAIRELGLFVDEEFSTKLCAAFLDLRTPTPEEADRLSQVLATSISRSSAGRERTLRDSLTPLGEVLNRITIDIDISQEAQIREVLLSATKPKKHKGFDQNFPAAMSKIREALEDYQAEALFSAPSRWLGGKDYGKRHTREVNKLAKALGVAAAALENVTASQQEALLTCPNVLRLTTQRLGAQPQDIPLAAALRIMESLLKARRIPPSRAKPARDTNECRAHLLRKLAAIFEDITGKTPGYTQREKGGEDGEPTQLPMFSSSFISLLEVIYEIIGVETSEVALGWQVKRYRMGKTGGERKKPHQTKTDL